MGHSHSPLPSLQNFSDFISYWQDELSQSKERVQARDREVEKLKGQIEAQLTTLQDDHTAKEALLNEKNLLQEKLENALRESEEIKRESRKESEGAKREREEAIREMEEVRKQLESTGGKEEMQTGLKQEVEMMQAENQGLMKKVANFEQQMGVKMQQLKEVCLSVSLLQFLVLSASETNCLSHVSTIFGFLCTMYHIFNMRHIYWYPCIYHMYRVRGMKCLKTLLHMI